MMVIDHAKSSTSAEKTNSIEIFEEKNLRIALSAECT
jgi:hypothetical protein